MKKQLSKLKPKPRRQHEERKDITEAIEGLKKKGPSNI